MPKHGVARRLLTLTAVVPLLAFAGCASSGPAADRGAAERTPDRANVITAEQLEGVGRVSVYDAVRRLRPAWLRNRGYDSFQQSTVVKVYLDGQAVGGVGELRSLQSTNVEAIEWLDGMTATQRFGMDHGAGVILVTRTRGARR